MRCGPCRALTPVLEKVAAAYADKGVVLAKVDTDKNQFIAAQFQIRSIPTVYAIFKGQPVADLTNARTESQLSQLLDQILRQLPIEGEAQAQAADVLARDANLGLVVLDLRRAPEADLRRIPGPQWYRLQRAVEPADLALLVETPRPSVPSAQLRFNLTTSHAPASFDLERPSLAAGLAPVLQRQRLSAAG